MLELFLFKNGDGSMNKRALIQFGVGLTLAALVAGCAHKQAPPPPKISAATQSALTNAEQCISQAQKLGIDVTQAQQLLTQAQQAAKSGNNDQAQSLANQVCQQTDAAINQYYLDKARQLDQEARQYANLSSEEQSQLQQGETSIANNQGKQAYDTLSALVAQLKAAKTTYTVMNGDNLWNIAKKPSIYGNPFDWPLIYLHNADMIKNPDLIYPDQQFQIWLNPLKTEAASASNYAKTRGPWRNGQALSKDRAWLNAQNAKMGQSGMGGGGH